MDAKVTIYEVGHRFSLVEVIQGLILAKSVVVFQQRFAFSSHLEDLGVLVVYGFDSVIEDGSHAILVGFIDAVWDWCRANSLRIDITLVVAEGEILHFPGDIDFIRGKLGCSFVYSNVVESVFERLDGIANASEMGDINIFYGDNPAKIAADLILAEDKRSPIAIVTEDMQILSGLEVLLSGNLCYQKPMKVCGLVSFILCILDAVICGSELPFYSGNQNNKKLYLLLSSLFNHPFDIEVLIAEVELITGVLFIDEIKKVLLSVQCDDVFEYRRALTPLINNSYFFEYKSGGYNCVYLLEQSRYVYQSKVIFINDRGYEGLFQKREYLRSTLKNLLYRCDVQIVHSSRLNIPYWLFNLQNMPSIKSTTVNTFERDSGSGVLKGRSITLDADMIPKCLTASEMRLLLTNQNRFYLQCILGIDPYTRPNESVEFAKLVSGVFLQCCKYGKFDIDDKNLQQFPHLRFIWRRRIEILAEEYMRLDAKRRRELGMLKVESKIRSLLRLNWYDLSVKVCCDRVEFYLGGDYKIINYVYTYGEPLEEFKMYLVLIAEGMKVKEGLYPFSAEIWVIGPGTITVHEVFDGEKSILESWTGIMDAFDKLMKTEKEIKLEVE